MGLFTPTQEGLEKNKLVTPAVWYPVEIFKVEDGQSKKDKSAYTKVHMRIIGGEFEGIILNTVFSEKWMEGVVPFVAAVTGRANNKEFQDEITKNPVEINQKSFAGRKLEVYVTRGKYKSDKNNKEYDQNTIEDYRPYGKAA